MLAEAELREVLLEEHATVEALLEHAIGAGTPEAWRAFCAGLTLQMQAEEEQLAGFATHERSVRVLVHEHQHLRERVSELDRLELPERAKGLRDLRDIFRAHTRVTAAQLASSEASSPSIVATNSATFTGLVR